MNSKRLLEVAQVLGPVAGEFVFVGGTITSLLITDPAANIDDVRNTDDVDGIVHVASLKEYHQLQARLATLGFHPDPADSASPICRLRRGSLVLDVMPDDESIVGFSNRWYRRSFETAMTVNLGGLEVRVVTAVMHCATKIEAFKGRGQNDFQASKDLEDLIAVVNGRDELPFEVSNAERSVKEYLAHEVYELLMKDDFITSMPGHLGSEEARAPLVELRLREIAGGLARF